MRFRVGDYVKPIGRSLAVAEFYCESNTVGLLTEYNTIFQYPARGSPFFMEPVYFYAIPYEEQRGDRGQVYHYTREKQGKVTRYEMILSPTFEQDGAYYLQPIDSPGGILIRRAEPYASAKPPEFSNWIQVELDSSIFESQIIRILSKNLGSVVYHNEVDDDLIRTSEAALLAEDGTMWWTKLTNLEKI